MFRKRNREDKTAERGRVEERGYNPMPEGWKPPANIPLIPASQPPQLQRRAEDRPASPLSGDSGE
ncbi:MAG: hypothetical protein OXJ37_22735 [Bryobacterales bacterium]|nr:hypothetical protein [Bryobacterales bacterium]MDE0265234.1 hypothetical protein [Bryobacterales bacterium]MXY68091.1 hypothetical protein [Terriglobia bacterium]MYG04336.1 hypothetical protein [Terriglobia bacterium]MYK09760.1 hypothetical protein [Terriglobia bacterium]